MNFDHALNNHLLCGRRITRDGWKAPGQFVFVSIGDGWSGSGRDFVTP